MSSAKNITQIDIRNYVEKLPKEWQPTEAAIDFTCLLLVKAKDIIPFNPAIGYDLSGFDSNDRVKPGNIDIEWKVNRDGQP
uniref:Uncharacterized protein n=1 Tax=Marseillevirus LCMAC101 TaxID=2506602 RepID=A0A481YSJ3_9VIRU|nr:MAG: hypothetical protein LCMAC101_00330 [Marseillevirus LCMAC101]